jgi:hypothetical protein
MSALTFIRVVVIGLILRFVGRRFRIPYIEGVTSVVVGVLFVQSVRMTSWWHGWHVYAVTVLGLVMIGAGTSNLWRQRPARRVEGS